MLSYSSFTFSFSFAKKKKNKPKKKEKLTVRHETSVPFIQRRGTINAGPELVPEMEE